MKLLHVLPNLDPRSGGTVAAVAGLALAQRKMGVDVQVACESANDCDERVIAQLKKGSVTVHTLEAGNRLDAVRQLPACVLNILSDVDAVHVHALWEEIQYQFVRGCIEKNIPYVLAPHGMLDPWSLNQSRFKKRIYRWLRLDRMLKCAKALHCTTQTELKLLAPLGIPVEKVVIPNGIDLAEFEKHGDRSHEQNVFFERFPELKDQAYIIFLSRLHPKKGLDHLLPAFEEANLADTQLVLAGPGERSYVEHLQRECRRLNIAERVLFTGMLYGGERVEALAFAKLFVLPSYQENFGIAVVEAMAAGTPVVISDQVNLCEDLLRYGLGEVVPLDTDKLARVLDEWMRDEARLNDHARRGIEFSKRFSFDCVAIRWQEVWKRLLA